MNVNRKYPSTTLIKATVQKLTRLTVLGVFVSFIWRIRSHVCTAVMAAVTSPKFFVWL